MIRFALYGVFFIGMILLFHPWLKYVTVWIRKDKGKQKREIKLYTHIQQLFRALYADQTDRIIDRKVILFFISSGMIVLGILTLLIRIHTGMMTFLFAFVLGLLPYFSLRLKLMSVQVTGSYEGELILFELLNQYKINYFNIREAIEKSVSYLEKAPIGKQLLFRLAMKLRTYGNEEELRSALDEFSYSCGTKWAETLSANIYYAMTEELNITAGLEDLLSDCEQIKKNIEKNKRLNNEALSIVKFLAPSIYLLFMWTLVKYFDLEVTEIIKFQFFTPTGAMLFFAMLVVGFASMAMASCLTRPKFDL